MLAALHALELVEPLSISAVDVDADEALVARYDELVPVLVASRDGQSPQQLCHYFLDEAAVLAFITQT
jgi:hypothetical protein